MQWILTCKKGSSDPHDIYLDTVKGYKPKLGGVVPRKRAIDDEGVWLVKAILPPAASEFLDGLELIDSAIQTGGHGLKPAMVPMVCNIVREVLVQQEAKAVAV